MMPSRLRLHSAKRVGRAPAFVLRVSAKSLAWLQGPGRAEVSMQYHGLLIDTDHRFPLRQRLFINGQHVFHAPNVLLIQFCYAPHFFPATVSVHDAAAECGSFPDPPAEPVCVLALPGR